MRTVSLKMGSNSDTRVPGRPWSPEQLNRLSGQASNPYHHCIAHPPDGGRDLLGCGQRYKQLVSQHAAHSLHTDHTPDFVRAPHRRKHS